jgi:NADH dehydrogenase
MPDDPKKPVRIVVVGGGIGGLVTATHLARRLRGTGLAEIVLVDRNRAHVWKPMLHRFAAGTATYADENISFMPHAKLTGYEYWAGDFGGLDRATKTVRLNPTPLPASGDALPATVIGYDMLVLALGSRANDYGTKGVHEHCHFIDDIGQARHLNDVLRSRVALAARAAQRVGMVIVGGGATGVELAAELMQRMAIVSGYDSDIAPSLLALTLIEAGPRLLSAFPASISAAAAAKLRALGVEVLTDTNVVRVDADGVSMAGDRLVPAELVVWAAGVQGPAVMSRLDGLALNRHGQVVVGKTLQTRDDPHIFALGDCAELDGADGKPLPSTAQVARQQALFLAKTLARHISRDAALGHFKYRNLGSLVALGPFAAYGTLGAYGVFKGAAFKGWLAQLGHAWLYRMHQLDINGPVRGAVIWLAARLNGLVKPRVRTS